MPNVRVSKSDCRTMKKEWYITFHGGAESTELNNIHVFSRDGKKLRKALNRSSLPGHVTLRELRGFTLGPDGNVYVVNAFEDYSQVLRFAGRLNDDGRHDFIDVFVEYHDPNNPGLQHPFSVVFDARGDLYVTSQNTSVTLRYHGPHSQAGLAGKPMPLPSALRGADEHRFHPGTFCASATHASNGLKTVRKALFAHGLLYVVDRDSDCVRKYDAVTGLYQGHIAAKGFIDKPIHLALKDDVLYVGNRGNESIVRFNLRDEHVSTFIAPKSGGLRNPAGLAFGDDGYFYVASRGTRQILRYRSDDGRPEGKPFIDGLPDDPEFIELISQI